MQPITITSNLPHPKFSYSQAVKIGDVVFVAGQIGADFENGGTVSDDFETQARQAFKNVEIVLKAAGSSMDKVAKTTIWLCDATNFDVLNKLYVEFFPTNPPARSTPVVALPRPNLQISIEVIASIG
jgi:2-iminobutanoate/2-iminopropanoate deaminase